MGSGASGSFSHRDHVSVSLLGASASLAVSAISGVISQASRVMALAWHAPGSVLLAAANGD